MSVLCFLAAIVLAALGVWWAAFIVFAMGLACSYDVVIRERAAIQAERERRERRLRGELRRHG